MSDERPRRIYLSTRRRRRRCDTRRSAETAALVLMAVCGVLAWGLFAVFLLH